MVIIKEERNLPNGTSMGVNELTDETLEGVVGGFEKRWKTSFKYYFSFDWEECKILKTQFGHAYTANEVAEILGCESKHDSVTDALKKRGFKQNGKTKIIQYLGEW